ncbi:uncharacterized protein STEHIDRAFT_114599 [Stereum hirsutum FP-91666 SS1]|uniref:uncharacterized protein n=1 Tax=Stereum hirsutum (strain FP-91666) TaxID=721885 RepID=UPI000444A139|nr:uncharacterized protein STEHIDRAFT_114599 [Stereum hirsutum FP-91666 SS1]EIM81914.1 hypothetical protein STEHIDRAFT_114599 [Stereum hirsutum FP-91666 SS1]
MYIMGSTARWKRFHYDVLADVHKACGFTPESDEVAKFLGFPLIEPFKMREEQLPHYNNFVPSAYISPPSSPSRQSSDTAVDHGPFLAVGDSITLFTAAGSELYTIVGVKQSRIDLGAEDVTIQSVASRAPYEKPLSYSAGNEGIREVVLHSLAVLL